MMNPGKPKLPSLKQASLISGALLLTLFSKLTGAADPDSTGTNGALLLSDFSPDSPDMNWYTQNDNVMGGRSKGGFNIVDNELVFTGSTNTNGGGFSSIRTRRFKLDLSEYQGIRVRVKADGRRYTWQINTNARRARYPVSYWSEFDTVDGEWTWVEIPFETFYPHFRGFKLDGPELDPGDITEFGLYIYDKKDGRFDFKMDRIEAY